RHADDVPAHPTEPAALRSSRKARPLHHDHRSRGLKAQRALLRDASGQLAQLRTIWVGGADMHDIRSRIIGVRSTSGAIEELVADDQVSRMQVRLQASNRGGADD